MSDETDPVRRALAGSRDLYDIATWDNRTLLDNVSVRLAAILTRGTRPLAVAVAATIILAQIALTGFVLVRNPTLAVLTVLSAVPALGLAGYIWYGDPTLRQPLRSLVVTFILGVVLAGFAAVVNGMFSFLFALVPVIGPALFFFLVVGPIEEFVKWLAVRFYAYRRPEFHAVIDGAVYGAIAGLGFATIENAIYITRVYMTAAEAGSSILPAAIGITSVRSLAGPGHVIYSAFAGYYLGLAKFNPESATPIIIKGLLIATLIHGTYNTAVTYLPSVIPFSFLSFVAFIVVFDGVFLYVLYRKLRRYRHAYHEIPTTA